MAREDAQRGRRVHTAAVDDEVVHRRRSGRASTCCEKERLRSVDVRR